MNRVRCSVVKFSRWLVWAPYLPLFSMGCAFKYYFRHVLVGFFKFAFPVRCALFIKISIFVTLALGIFAWSVPVGKSVSIFGVFNSGYIFIRFKWQTTSFPSDGTASHSWNIFSTLCTLMQSVHFIFCIHSSVSGFQVGRDLNYLIWFKTSLDIINVKLTVNFKITLSLNNSVSVLNIHKSSSTMIYTEDVHFICIHSFILSFQAGNDSN